MTDEGVKRVLSALRGVLAAAAATLAGMALISFLVIYAGLETGLLTLVNQILKVISIAVGVLSALGVGGEKGLITGAAVGILYNVIGYGFYCLIEGSQASPAAFAAETAAAGAIGAICGIILANITSSRRKRT